MAENLIIRLGSHAEDIIHWLVWSTIEKNIIASGELAGAEQLVELKDKAIARPVTVLVPTSDVALKSLNVPAKSQKAIRLAAPYMLEDELAQEVEQLFFAYGQNKSANESENCFVAAVEHEQMRRWLLWLAEAGISGKRMLPEVLALPKAEQHWQAIQLGEQIIVRQGEWQGLSLDANFWQLASHNWLKLGEISIDSYSALPESNEQININAQAEELPLALMAQHLDQQSFNLLQGEYQIKNQRSPLIKTWAWAASIAVCALLLNVALKSVTLMQISSQQQTVEQQIIAQYKSAFPETKRVRVSTIRSQLKRKLAAIGSGGQEESFLTLLAKMQPIFLQVPQLKPDAIRFDGKRNELRLQATADGYQQFEQFKTLLEGKQFSVSQGAQNNQGDKVSGSFSITQSTGGRS